MVHQHRNRYDEEFKKRAVSHHVDNHGTLADSAARFGITASMLSKWVDLYSSDEHGQAMNCEAEIRRLKDEMRALKEIVGKIFMQKITVDEIIDRMVDEPEKFLAVDEFPSKEQ